jgi:hypothetical protein
MADYRSAPVTLIRFSEDHEFSLIHCWIFDDEKMEISNGDGLVVYIGTWTPGEAGIDTQFRLVYERVQPVGGGHYPGPWEKAKATLLGNKVRFHEKDFQAVPNLDFAEFETFVSDHRSKLENSHP